MQMLVEVQTPTALPVSQVSPGPGFVGSKSGAVMQHSMSVPPGQKPGTEVPVHFLAREQVPDTFLTVQGLPMLGPGGSGSGASVVQHCTSTPPPQYPGVEVPAQSEVRSHTPAMPPGSSHGSPTPSSALVIPLQHCGSQYTQYKIAKALNANLDLRRSGTQEPLGGTACIGTGGQFDTGSGVSSGVCAAAVVIFLTVGDCQKTDDRKEGVRMHD